MPPCNRNAKINKQLNFNLEAQDIRAMTKCPRCNLEQEESPQCDYCGLVFEEFKDSIQTSKFVHPKRTVLFVIILVVAGALLAFYLLIPIKTNPAKNPQARSVQVISPKEPTKMISGQRQKNCPVMAEF